jgi:alpha-N-arabinofuranosidase
MNCYAPMFVNVNPGARQWRPNLIGYDGLRVYGSPSYHAIKMFSTHIGDQILKATAAGTDVLVSATRDSRSGTIYVKLVNAGDAQTDVQLNITGVRALAPTATAVTLAAAPTATNSIDAPQVVAPVTTKVNGVMPQFTYKVPAHGIVVLTLAGR